jgi:UDP-3-O-[3-hydroxymyristoyl] glucosamine N-acyltransferase
MFLPLSFKNNCKFREEKFNYIKSLGYSFFTFISKTARCYSERSNIGDNVYVGTFAGIHPNVIIEDNVYISEGSLTGHNSIIGSHSFIGANVVINGSCKIGKRVTIGANAVIREGVSIVDGAVIGIGVAIHRDIITAKTHILSPIYEKHYRHRNSKRI